MADVKFKKFPALPDPPVPGTFYWIGREVWFATDDSAVLLSNKVSEDLVERLERIEEEVGDINEILGSDGSFVTEDDLTRRLEEIREDILSRIGDLTSSDFGDFVTRDELDDYLKKEDYHPYVVDLGDSDYDEIAERVNLRWSVIKE